MACSRAYIGLLVWQEVISKVKDGLSITKNCKGARSNYHHGTFLAFKKKGWVELKKRGREQLVILTPEGKKMQRAALILKNGVCKKN